MFIGFANEKYFYHNTLICLLHNLKCKNITVDLRNDSYVCGQLILVDGYMNLSFSNAVYCDPQGNEYSFENLFIQGRNIRYVHIPESINIISSIKKELHLHKKEPRGNPMATARKVHKARQQHLNTVAALNAGPSHQ